MLALSFLLRYRASFLFLCCGFFPPGVCVVGVCSPVWVPVHVGILDREMFDRWELGASLYQLSIALAPDILQCHACFRVRTGLDQNTP